MESKSVIVLDIQFFTDVEVIMKTVIVLVGKIVFLLPVSDVLHKDTHQNLPFVEVYQQVSEAAVVLPAYTTFLRVGSESKRLFGFLLRHLCNLIVKLGIAIRHCLQQF